MRNRGTWEPIAGEKVRAPVVVAGVRQADVERKVGRE
jgi:hypothetical protein